MSDSAEPRDSLTPETNADWHLDAADDLQLEPGLQAAFASDADDAADWMQASAHPSEQPGEIIDNRYRLIEVIGQGGMGTVWMAEQREPVRRKVALKLIKLGMDSRSVLTRFEAERQALALMDHPHIAKVFDGGVTQTGRPYFVMELVKGVPITQFCDARRLAPNQRLELLLPVCQAIQHAHQKGIIHRDIKPSNVLIALHDELPVPKIIDFGLAKATGFDLTERTLHTGFHAVLGTIEYMSPEQAKLNNRDIDTRSDVYSLGVLLYELLSGSPPFRRKELENQALDEVLRVIREVDPVRPSLKLSTSETKASISAARSFEPLELTRTLADDLDWIALKALDKDRSRRYQTANALARDIERYLNHDEVEARPPNVGYRVRKFVVRNRKLVVATLMMLGLILLGSTVSIWQAVRATQAFRIAQANEQRALASEREVQQAIRSERAAREAEKQQFELAERRRLEAEAALEESERQRAVAQAAQARARQVLDSMTSSMAGEYLTSQEILTPEQREFLQQALQLYQELSSSQSEDDQTLNGALVAMRLSWTQIALGDNQAAILNFQQNLDKLKSLHQQNPDREGVEDLLIDSYKHYGYSLWRQGQGDQARQAYEAGIELARDRLSKQQMDKRWLQIAGLKHNLGLLHRDRAETEPMLEQLRESARIFESFNPKYAADFSFQCSAAICETSLGIAESSVGNWDSSTRVLSQSKARLEKLTQQEPANMRFALYYAILLREIGRQHNLRAEFEPASHSCLQSVSILQEQIRRLPFALELKSELAGTWAVLYQIESHRQQYKQAQDYLEDAQKLMRGLVQSQPRSFEFYSRLSSLSIELARLHLQEKQLEQAATQYLGLLERWQKSLKDGTLESLTPSADWYLYRREMAMASGFVEQRGDEFWDLAKYFNQCLLPGDERTADRHFGETVMLTERTWGFMARDAPEEALAVLNKTEDKTFVQPNCLYNLARCYGQVAAARGDRAELRESAALKAIELLKRARAAGWQNVQDATINTDFNSLRERPDFQQWLIQDPDT